MGEGYAVFFLYLTCRPAAFVYFPFFAHQLSYNFTYYIYFKAWLTYI